RVHANHHMAIAPNSDVRRTHGPDPLADHRRDTGPAVCDEDVRGCVGAVTVGEVELGRDRVEGTAGIDPVPVPVTHHRLDACPTTGKDHVRGAVGVAVAQVVLGPERVEDADGVGAVTVPVTHHRYHPGPPALNDH